MPEHPVRYRSHDEDSARWDGFEFRSGDIVISTRSKSGTTWMQMICALLIFQTSELPAPLGRLSPWLDWLIVSREQVFARLAAQTHRRFIKTHTPLDGIPLDQRATYIVVGRHPLDMAVSLYHQGENINRERVRELTSRSAAEPAPGEPRVETPGEPRVEAPGESRVEETGNVTAGAQQARSVRQPRQPLRDWLLSWIDREAQPDEELDSLPGVLWHISDAWARRTVPGRSEPPLHGPAVLLVHYDDLSADLEGEMRRLAGLLGIAVPERLWPSLVRAASFQEMRAHAVAQVPDPAGVLRDPAAFFRRGTSGAGRELLSADELARYQASAARLAAPDVLAWLHHD